MKSEPFDKYCKDKFGKDNYIKWLGIRADEPQRLKTKDGVKYLAYISDFEKVDILKYWANYKYDLQIPEWLGNCVFCMQKKNSKIALAARQEPELAKEFSIMIEEAKDRDDRDKRNIYQHKISIDKIIQNFKDVGEKQLTQRMMRGRREDQGDCGDSCEPFTDDFFGYEN
jgi:hypothetical protein